MSRMNNKGFLLAESLIVSTFVLTVLIFLFVQFKNLMVNHKQSYTYNSVENIYDLGSMSDYFKNNEKDNNALSTTLESIGNNNNLKIYDKNSGCLESVLKPGSKGTCDTLGQKIGIEYILYTDSDVDNIDLSKIEYQEMRDFIDKVDATPVQNKGRLFAKFSNGNFATIAMEQKIDITIPSRVVTYELGNGNDMNWWSKLHHTAFNSINYNASTKMNTINITTTSAGWEQLYMPIQTVAGQSYTLQFDYKIVTDIPKLNDAHPGIAYQMLADNTDDQALGTELSSSDHQSETALKITTDTLPIEAESTGTKTINFTAKSGTTVSYLVFNFGYMQDGETGTIELGNIRVVQDITNRTMYGPMLSPKFGQPDDTHASIQPVVNPHNFRGWFDETHLDQNGNQIEIRETTAISPSLFTTDGKETVVAHFD